jgi:hypothetical protein
MKNTILLCLFIAMFSFKNEKDDEAVVTNAAMPSIAKDAKGNVYIAFASGNKLEYVISKDNGGHFSKPVLIDTIADLFAVAGRGPHIVSTLSGLAIIVLDKAGNIYAYTQDANDSWIKRGKVNDVPDVCKEGFLSISAKGDSMYAAWLDIRNTNKNKIAGTLSADGGKTWSKNKIIYQSPEGSVCECCNVSVAFAKNDINVMFRNNANGNRDLYLIQSHNGGSSFEEAKKLGEGSWKLNACPMDGGGIAVYDDGTVQTVWRRIDTIYSCKLGEKETMIGIGKNCIIANLNNQNVYTWIENKTIVCLLPNGKKVNIGEGVFPVLKAVSKNQLLCAWQNNNNVYCKIISI